MKALECFDVSCISTYKINNKVKINKQYDCLELACWKLQTQTSANNLKICRWSLRKKMLVFFSETVILIILNDFLIQLNT